MRSEILNVRKQEREYIFTDSHNDTNEVCTMKPVKSETMETNTKYYRIDYFVDKSKDGSKLSDFVFI